MTLHTYWSNLIKQNHDLLEELPLEQFKHLFRKYGKYSSKELENYWNFIRRHGVMELLKQRNCPTHAVICGLHYLLTVQNCEVQS